MWFYCPDLQDWIQCALVTMVPSGSRSVAVRDLWRSPPIRTSFQRVGKNLWKRHQGSFYHPCPFHKHKQRQPARTVIELYSMWPQNAFVCGTWSFIIGFIDIHTVDGPNLARTGNNYQPHLGYIPMDFPWISCRKLRIPQEDDYEEPAAHGWILTLGPHWNWWAKHIGCCMPT